MYARTSCKYYANKNSTGKIVLKLRLTVNGRRYELYPAIAIELHQWNQKAQKIKGAPDSYELNDALEEFKRKCIEVESTLRGELGEYSAKQLKDAVKRVWVDGDTVTSSGVPKRFWDFFDYCIEYKKQVGKDGKHTVGHYIRLKGLLKNFQSNLEWSDLTDQFYQRFCEYCEDDGHSLAYIGKHITYIKAVLNLAVDERIEAAIRVNTRNWKAYNTIKRVTTLSYDELQSLYDLDLSEEPSLDKARNLFYFACWYAFRPSDFTKLGGANIEEDSIVIRARKTSRNSALKEDLILPLVTPINKLMDRIGGVPDTVSAQYMNRLLPVLGERLGMIQPITINEQKLDGSITTFQVKRFERLKCQSARKTFASNYEEFGLTKKVAMSITGHKTEEAFNHYVMTERIENNQQYRTKVNERFNEANSTPQ
ncbi:MAG: hypothetical protein HOA37_10305 [Flavobacteriales bacterium]|jgi:hypothetical protein|nr:hypothetical protein [Flavobacteriales bacterium]MBT6917653.1 hypothetical protein [Flavobacteriales bacterium]